MTETEKPIVLKKRKFPIRIVEVLRHEGVPVRSEFPHDLVTLDYDADGNLLAVSVCGSDLRVTTYDADPLNLIGPANPHLELDREAYNRGNEHPFKDKQASSFAGDARDIEAKSYWQTPTGQLDQAIREGLRNANVKGMLAHLVGPILASVQTELDQRRGDIDYEHDWAGECRTDPSDGNSYVLRSVERDQADIPWVQVNDILGGHARQLTLVEWLTWPTEAT